MTDRTFINQAIKFPRVLCIDSKNNNLGIIPISQALNIAMEQNLDLVQVGPPDRDRVPTCKILDHGKYKYELSKKKKESDRKQRETTVKTHEIKFRPVTDINDLRVKAKKTDEFLVDGDKVKIAVVFTGREITHKEVAYKTLNEFMNLIPNVKFTSPPILEGKSLSVFIEKTDSKVSQH